MNKLFREETGESVIATATGMIPVPLKTENKWRILNEQKIKKDRNILSEYCEKWKKNISEKIEIFPFLRIKSLNYCVNLDSQKPSRLYFVKIILVYILLGLQYSSFITYIQHTHISIK